MRAPSEQRPGVHPAILAALGVAAAGLATILGALYFEYGLKLRPCPLCLEQRIPYYVVIPLGVAVGTAAYLRAPRMLIIGGLVLMIAALVWNAGLGVYHSGIEWKLWAGPQDCSGAMENLGGGGGLLQQLETIRVVRCDEAAWRFLGLSLAGYNVLISLALAALAAWGVVATRRRISA